jgi:UDP-N-acetylglucosamine acyltransferase
MSNIYNFDKKGNKIHSTAIIDDDVILGSDNYIGAYTIIKSGTIIDNNNYIGSHCIIGDMPEKVGSFKDKRGVTIGNNNIFTKQVTIDAGSFKNTIINDNVIMLKNAHIGHDTNILNNCTIGCNVSIGGGSSVEGFSNLGLNVSVHQRSYIPMGSMVGAGSFWKDNFDDGCDMDDEFWTWVGSPAIKKKPNNIGYNRYVNFKENETNKRN